MPGPPEHPKYSDKDLQIYCTQMVEMSREVLPDDMRVVVIVVDGSELKDRKLRTRMMSNMGTKLTEKVFETAGRNIGQVIPAKRHYALRMGAGHIGVSPK